MNLLSIDVGIKNLAYVHFFIDPIHKRTTITGWDVISLLPKNKHANKECMGVHKSKKTKCKSVAIYNKNDLYFCKKHAKSSNIFHVPNQQTNYKKLKNKKLCDIKEFCKQYELEIEDCKYKDDYLRKAKDFIDNSFYERITEASANDADLVSLGRAMASEFDTLFESIVFDVICIENQISPIANRMKTLQGMISQYFIMKECKTIEFIASSNKLKPYITQNKTTYAERKKMGVDITRKHLEENKDISKWHTHFETHKKKDDLADCYLQGLYYIDYVLNK